MEQKLHDKAFRAIAEYGMLEDVRGVLIGFSGGADSGALLHLLKKICDERGIYISALHVHHNIRGAEADSDAEFCLAECQKLQIDCKVEYFDVPSIAKKLNKGIEETARICRYEAFVKAVNADGRLNCIATAHNADDNAETVIYNLARGCGIDGLCGIPPMRYENGIKLIRPMIFCTKDEIYAYLNSIQVPYIFDSTNDDTAYRRNFIRHEIMPRLREVNPSFADAAARTGSLLRRDSAYIDEAVKRFLTENSVNGALSVSLLDSTENAVFSRVVIKLLSDITDAMPEYTHIKAVRELVKAGRNNTSVSVCGGVRAIIEKGMLYFTNDRETVPDSFTFPISYGVNRNGASGFALLCAQSGEALSHLQKNNETLQNIYKLSIHTKLNFDKINGELFARSRIDGDSYIFGGMTRKLKKLFNDRKLPERVRHSLPIICDNEGIVWVPGFAPADRVRSVRDTDGGLVYYSNIGELL